MCQVEWADPWKIHNSTHRVARKTHTCYDCARKIRPGERYLAASGLVDGAATWDYMKVCAHCEAAGEWLRVVCNGWLYGGIGEELREHWDESPEFRSGALFRLIAGHQRRWEVRGRLVTVPDFAGDAGRAVMEPVWEQEREQRRRADERAAQHREACRRLSEEIQRQAG